MHDESLGRGLPQPDSPPVRALRAVLAVADGGHFREHELARVIDETPLASDRVSASRPPTRAAGSWTARDAIQAHGFSRIFAASLTFTFHDLVVPVTQQFDPAVWRHAVATGLLVQTLGERGLFCPHLGFGAGLTHSACAMLRELADESSPAEAGEVMEWWRLPTVGFDPTGDVIIQSACEIVRRSGIGEAMHCEGFARSSPLYASQLLDALDGSGGSERLAMLTDLLIGWTRLEPYARTAAS